MLKISIAALALLGLGFLVFPQLRIGLVLLAPFTPLIICLAMCPLMMYFGMGGMKKDDHSEKSEKM